MDAVCLLFLTALRPTSDVFRKCGPWLPNVAHKRNAKLIRDNTDQSVKYTTMRAFREYNQSGNAIQGSSCESDDLCLEISVRVLEFMWVLFR